MNIFFSFHILRTLTVILCLISAASLFAYRHIAAALPKKRRFWLGIGGTLTALALTIALHLWGMPRGLSAQYFPNAAWAVDPALELDRHFEPDGTGRRVDRFLDFNPNDFNDRYPFSNGIFTVKWEGTLYLPEPAATVSVDSNFDSWLVIDDVLTETRISTPQALDIGTPEARSFLRRGWSFDERSGKNPNLNFAWATNDDVHFVIGIHEIAEYEFSFRCTPYSFPGNPPQQVSVFLGDTQIGSVPLNDGWQTYTLPLSAAMVEAFGTGTLDGTLLFSRNTKPAEVLAGSHDTRELAAAFDSIELRQTSPARSSKLVRPGKTLESGMHNIQIKAKSSAKNPYLRLTTQTADHAAPVVVLEDHLFPNNGCCPQESLMKRLRIEHAARMGLVGFELALLLVYAGVLGRVALLWASQRRRLLTPMNGALFAICAAAFALRFAYLLELKTLDPSFYILPDGTDHLVFLFSARGFLRGYWPWLSHGVLHFNPLVILYLIVQQMLFGEHLMISRFIVMLLSLLEIAMIYDLARRHFSSAVAIIAALLYALNGVQVFFSSSLLIAPQVTFLNVAVIWYASRHAEDFSLKTAAVIGVLFGLLAVGRPTFLLFMPCVFLWIFWRKQRTFLQKCVYCIVIWAVCFVVISPITLVNYFSTPERPFVLVTGAGGWNFWMGNNLKATGAYGYDTEWLRKTSEHMQATGSSYADEVWLFLKHSPKEFFALQWKKFLMFWRGYEISNLMPYYLARETSAILRQPLINFVLLAPFGIAGMFAFRRQWRALFLLYAYVFVQMCLNVGFLTLDRYRLPVVPILTVFAAAAFWKIIVHLRQKQWITALMLFGICALLYVGLNYRDAARLYEMEHGSPMPLSQLLRYWDIFASWKFTV